jgi:hypothetical protein
MLIKAVFLTKGGKGVNVTVIWHELFAYTIEQSSDSLNSDQFVPEMVIEFIRSPLPVFLTVTVLGFDVLPTLTEPKLTDMGLTEILGVP